jgi:ubiquinone/menaquinone biosynthesis C-methylase UbiE
MEIKNNKSLQSFNPSNGVVVEASTINISLLPDHIKPKQVRDEIPTLNKFGYMKFEFEEFSQYFVDYAKATKNQVLEIGTAYGWIVNKVLEADAKIVANDISKEHLEVLLKQAPQDKLNNLSVIKGDFSKEVDFKKNRFGAVLASRIFHFLEGEEIEKGLDKIHDWLVEGGKLICTNCSIYHSSVKAQMSETFEKRIAAGDKWAGVVRSIHKQDQVHKDYSRDFINTFYKEQLEELLPKHGFKIEKIKYFDYPSDPWLDEGKGHIGFIATKI